MAAATQLISLEAYLQTSYHPDRDFVDGVIEPRRPGEEDSIEQAFEAHSMGEYEHSRTQMFLAAWFFAREREWNLRVVTGQRTRVSADRVRIRT